MYAKDVVRFVEAMAPRTIVPIHTFEPEKYGRRFKNVYLHQRQRRQPNFRLFTAASMLVDKVSDAG